jgi:hypothetical protein
MTEKCEIFEDQILTLENRVSQMDKKSYEENSLYSISIKELEERILVLSSTTLLEQTRLRVKFLEDQITSYATIGMCI